eukprot:UN00232
MATYDYVKNGKVRLLKDPDLTDVDTDSSSDEQHHVFNHWCWESDYGYQPYHLSVSYKLDGLNIGEVYNLYINNTTYQIKKTAYDEAIQTNMTNGLYRKAIRQSNKPNNLNKNNQYESKQSNKNDDNVKELQYVWFYSGDNGALQSCDYNTSKELNNLKIGGLYKTYINNTQYIFTKSANDICQQRTGSSNKCQTVIRQSVGNKHNMKNNELDPYGKNKNNHAWTGPHHSNQNIKHSKWYWKADNGKYQPLSDHISSKLPALKI